MMSGLVPQQGLDAARGGAGGSGELDEEALFARVLAQQIRSALPEEALGGEWGDAFGPLLDDVLSVQLREKLAATRQGHAAGRSEATVRREVEALAARPRPVAGEVRVSSTFGHRIHPVTGKHAMHHGLDLAAPKGTPIRAGQGGVVVRAEDAGTYGNLVVVDHGNGVTTRYAHCDRLQVRAGDEISAGTTLATVGSTGRSTGPHLHYEVRIEGRAVNPQDARWNDLFPQVGGGVSR